MVVCRRACKRSSALIAIYKLQLNVVDFWGPPVTIYHHPSSGLEVAEAQVLLASENHNIPAFSGFARHYTFTVYYDFISIYCDNILNRITYVLIYVKRDKILVIKTELMDCLEPVVARRTRGLVVFV